MISGCIEESCTVAETGVCLNNNDPSTCPNRLEKTGRSNLRVATVDVEPPLKEPEENPRFPASGTLTTTHVRELMRSRYVRLVGILGEPAAGKTASLVSLYLLASRGRLKGFSFADSKTLRGFHDICRGSRKWDNSQLPEQLTTHTELADERTAGFLHIRLRSSTHECVADLLLPDLPGEWTTALANSSRVDRLDFLKRADVFWLVVNGDELSKPDTRQWALHRVKLLFQRLVELMAPVPRVILVLTRRDQRNPDQETLDNLCADARTRGLNLEVVSIASFSDSDSVEPGEGIAELVASSTQTVRIRPPLWPDAQEKRANARVMLRIPRG